MFARATAALLVLVLVGPSVVAATCELTCALGAHHRDAPPSTEAPCHEHQGSNEGAGVHAIPSTPCHESGDLPSAIVDAWLDSVIVVAPPAEALVFAPAITTAAIGRVPDGRAVFDTRPPHTPLRV